MSREVIIKVRDDLDGSDADETVVFSVRGVTYEIDLSATNVELFEKSFQQFIDASRRVQPVSATTAAAPKSPTRERELKQRRREIRGWASRNGWPELGEANARRLPYDAVEAYQATHPEVELPPEIVPPTRGPAKPKGDELESITAQQMLALGAVHDGGGVSATKLVEKPKPKKRKTPKRDYLSSAQRAIENRRELFGDKLDGLDKDRRNEIRVWARANGWTLGDKGLIKAEILEAYFNAHPEDN